MSKFVRFITCSLLIMHAIAINKPVYEKPIVIVIPSYNNMQWIKNNLDSVVHQQYTNYRVIYIDDNSTDGTYEFAKQYLSVASPRHLIIKRAQRCGAGANRYAGVWLCKDEEIVVLLDGDDSFANDKVLQHINTAYKNPEVWCTYGQYAPSDGSAGGCRPMSKEILVKQLVRKMCGWHTTHPRTFYAWLFKKIKLADLLYCGSFLPMSSDTAETLPILEMATWHTRFISDVLYTYNVTTPTNDNKINKNLQFYLAKDIIKRRPIYPALKNTYQPKHESPRLSAIVIVGDTAAIKRPYSAIKASGINCGKVFTLDRTTIPSIYTKNSRRWPGHTPASQSTEELKKYLNKNSRNDYCLVIQSADPIPHIDWPEICAMLTQTQALAYLFEPRLDFKATPVANLLAPDGIAEAYAAVDLGQIDYSQIPSLKDTMICKNEFLYQMLSGYPKIVIGETAIFRCDTPQANVARAN